MPKLAIETKRLTKTYQQKTALDGLDLTVKTGEIFGLLGHNGAGKTTTVSLLTTLLEPSSGSAKIWGHDIVQDSRQVQRSIGYLPENVQFYDNLTLLENLTFFGELSQVPNVKQRISKVLELLDFTGHDSEKLGTFSKGMRQRVGIAQAILHKPKLLFLDEPTSGLDPQGVKGLRNLILKLNKELGITVFMNTHLLSEVTQTCTTIGILRAGQLVYHDSLKRTLAAFPNESSLENIYLHIEKG
ncbi:MAG: ABC transporter ATP-binding protein [Candidatus Saccharimonadales bacterium]